MIRHALRRLALAPLLVLGLAAGAHAESKTVPADKVFPFLEGYLKLPPAERSRFVLGYRLVGDPKALQTVRLALVDKGGTVPLDIAADGRVERLPTLKSFEAADKVTIEAAKGSRIGLSLLVEPTARPAQEMDAAELAATLVQAQAAETKLAGLFAFAAPRLTRVAFEGAARGEAVGADGRVRPLPLAKGRPVFDPEALKGVKTLRFPNAPVRVVLIDGA